MLSNARVPLLGFAAFSGVGKTSLLCRLIPILREQHGLRLGVIKHAHHDFDLDYPGKDSYRLRKAGAAQTLVASRRRWALISERENRADDPRLDDLLLHLAQDQLDLLLVEGFKHERLAKIELHRPALGKPLLYPDDKDIIALASDAPLSPGRPLPLLDLNRPGQIAEFVLDYAMNHPTPRNP